MDVMYFKNKVRNNPKLFELVKYVNDYVCALGAEVGDDLADWRVEVRRGFPRPSADPDETPMQ